MLNGHLRPKEKISFTVAFFLGERCDLVKPHANPLMITTLISSF